MIIITVVVVDVVLFIDPSLHISHEELLLLLTVPWNFHVPSRNVVLSNEHDIERFLLFVFCAQTIETL